MCSTWNNLARFILERQELFMPSRSFTSAMSLALKQETSGYAVCRGLGIGKPAAPAEGPHSSALEQVLLLPGRCTPILLLMGVSSVAKVSPEL